VRSGRNIPFATQSEAIPVPSCEPDSGPQVVRGARMAPADTRTAGQKQDIPRIESRGATTLKNDHVRRSSRAGLLIQFNDAPPDAKDLQPMDDFGGALYVRHVLQCVDPIALTKSDGGRCDNRPRPIDRGLMRPADTLRTRLAL
jgi:hypothetical protein